MAGPVVSADQYEEVQKYVGIGREEVGDPLVGGNAPDRPGYFVEPTIFDGVNNDDHIAQEEIFGPVVVEADTVGRSDVFVGRAGEFEVYVPAVRENARDGYALTIDAVEAEGVGSFSLEVPLGYRLTVEERREKGD